MVSYCPLCGPLYVNLNQIRLLSCEVPQGASGSGDELHYGNKEGDDPEESEEENPEHPLCFFISLKQGEHVLLDKNWLTSRIEECGGDGEPAKDWNHGDVCHNGCNNDLWLS